MSLETPKPSSALKLTPAHLHALRHFDSLPDAAEVPDAVVAVMLSITRQTVWKWAGNRLPAPIKRGGITRWKVGAIRRMLATEV